MATVENGTYTGYIFDRDNILAEYNKDDSRTTRYIWGYDLISQKKDAGETYHYLHNAHGDITKLVGSIGNVQNSYSYDAFGNTITYSEKVGNKFRYSGEQYDSITGEYYLRARYCDPSMGRFINEDTYRGQIDNPLSLNLYTYCYNNPIIYTDRSGNTPMVSKDGGLYFFVPDDPITNSVDDLYGFIIGGGWINKQLHKVLGETFITKKDIDFTLDVLGESEVIGKILKADEKLLKALHILGKSASLISNVLTAKAIINDFIDTSWQKNDIIDRLFGGMLTSDTRQGVIDKYVISLNAVNKMLKKHMLHYKYSKWGEFLGYGLTEQGEELVSSLNKLFHKMNNKCKS